MASRLLIADNTGDELWEIDPDGGNTEGTLLRDLPTTLTAPVGMTVLGGRLLIADNTGGELWEIDPDGGNTEGTLLRDLPTTLTAPFGMAVLGGRLLIADNLGDELWEIDPDGANTEGTLLRDLPTTLTAPFGMTVLGGRLLIADNTGDELWEIDPDGANTEGTLLRDLPTTLTAPVGMTVLGGRLLIADDTGDDLWEIDPDGANTEGTLLRDLPTTLTGPFAMAALPSLAVPAFADNTGGTQFWTQNTAITPVTVPEASGTPAPTYAVVGALPAGLAFNTTLRFISGTPTNAGAGAIIIRATNSEGSDDWTVAYITTAATTKPATPAAPTLSVNSSSVITATGVAPDDGGAPINSYDWRWKRTDRTTWNDRFDQTNLTQIFSGLLGSTEYEIQFRATNKVGDSEYSLSGVATTLRTPVHFTVNAGDVAVAFAAPQPTVTRTAPVLRAVLTDWDVTGLQVEVRALIRAGGLAQSGGLLALHVSGPGAAPNWPAS